MIDQVGIVLFGVAGVGLAQAQTQRVRRWACVSGLIAQPFWFWSTWGAQQWGAFFVCVLYTAMWLLGLWTNWIQPWRAARVRHPDPRIHNARETIKCQ